MYLLLIILTWLSKWPFALPHTFRKILKKYGLSMKKNNSKKEKLGYGNQRLSRLLSLV